MPLIFALLLSAAGAPIGSPWVAWHEMKILSLGEPLPENIQVWAQQKGVLHTEQIRVLHADPVPLPAPPFLRKFLAKFGYPTTSVGGLCLRHGIYLQAGVPLDSETLRHELIHTRQYQEAGSITFFLYRYLFQSLTKGYYNGAFEVEARAETK